MSHTTSPTADATCRTQRLVSAAPGTVFAAFSHADRLAKWWGPNGFRNTFETFEFVPGGRWVFVMHGPDGKAYPTESVFREIKADSRIVIEHVSHPRFTLSVVFLAVGEETNVTWVQEFEDAAVAQRVRHIVEPAGPARRNDLVKAADPRG